MNPLRRLARIDPWLATALLAAAVFCLYGCHWGRVECWNRDQMAMRGLRWLAPGGFAKPPFHTYLNHLIVLGPITVTEAIASAVSGKKLMWNEARLLGSRFLVVALFLGTVALLYVISLRAYGKFAARVLALVAATSAGLISYTHFLSCDSPLLFFMVAAAFFAQRIVISGTTRDYVFAGLVTGIAAATKYNGVAVGITIVVAHLLSQNCRDLKSCLFAPRLILGVGMVLVGFVLGNPFAVITPKKFIGDFMYNYTVTPHYKGQTGVGYGDFLWRIPELLGWPGAILIATCVVLSAFVAITRRKTHPAVFQGFVIAASLALLYYVKIGSFARMPTRFVLPTIPFFILMAGPMLQALERKRVLVHVALVPVLCYNALCSAYVGKRFSDDPRMAAQKWMIANVPLGSVIESSAGSPHWARLPELNAVDMTLQKPKWSKLHGGVTADLRMPHVTGRAELFERIFPDNRWVQEEVREKEGKPNESLFSAEELGRRNPLVVTAYSSDTNAPSKAARNYYAQLLAGHLGYRIAFDARSPAVPRWIYPRSIDFLNGRMTILTRETPPS